MCTLWHQVTWTAIRSFSLVTENPARLVEFYEAIGFTAQDAQPIAAAEMRALGLLGAGERRRLELGDSRIDLDTYADPGRPYPDDANAADLVFQHFALTTDDAHAAWGHAEAAGARPISRDGAIHLPPSSGGVTAIKFRDPDGHPLEFLQFPQGSRSAWHGYGVLGIDHSAISIADVAVSRAFYAGMGLREGDATLNTGPAQVALDGLDGVSVDVVPMIPSAKRPHLELLGYRQPRGRTQTPLAANDCAASRVVWIAGREALVRDPDGHLHQLTR